MRAIELIELFKLFYNNGLEMLGTLHNVITSLHAIYFLKLSTPLISKKFVHPVQNVLRCSLGWKNKTRYSWNETTFIIPLEDLEKCYMMSGLKMKNAIIVWIGSKIIQKTTSAQKLIFNGQQILNFWVFSIAFHTF